MTDLIGKVFENKYRLVRLLGEGGMGSVYEAEHTVINRSVAVKVMHPNIASSPEAVNRFFREAQAASAIGHPNIVEIHDVGRDQDGMVFMVMELLRGESLRSLLATRGPLPPARTISIVLQVLSALHAAHSKGIIHRDLKADNVFLGVDARMREEVKLLDFGIAKVTGSDMDQDFNLTKTGTIMGTPNYLSPEQARGRRDIDHRIDIWAVGVLLYETLTAHLPFDGESYNEILSKVLMEQPKPLAELAPDTPPALLAIVDKALAKEREDRYPSVAKMIGALMPLHDSGTELMSTQAAHALKSSLPPPPYVPASGDDEEETRQPDFVRTLDMPIPAVSHDFVKTIHPTPKGIRRRRTVIAAAGAALLAAVSIIAVVAGTGPQTSPPQAHPGVGIGARPALRTPASAPAASAPSVAPQPEKLPDTVDFAIRGLPPNARVTLGGARISPPVRVSRSSAPLILKVTALGYQPYEQAVVLDKDVALDVAMARIGAKAAPAKTGPAPVKEGAARPANPYTGDKKKPVTAPATKKKERKADKVWANNPFG